MLPEVVALHRIGSLVRIPPAQDVPVSDRVRRILDLAPMRRLASISQLGMVSLVYPGATHSRLEHSLGVYHNALRVLARFSSDTEFTQRINPAMAEAFVVAALIHDVGHWPFCHPIEDMEIGELGEHESRIRQIINNTGLADCIEQDWQCDSSQVLSLLESELPDQSQATEKEACHFLRSCISGPVDIDKLDYLQRDSLHAGVPYGRNFDAGRLISSLCFNAATSRLAIMDKGRTAAEMMVFSRYVMFSEVYWHHAVRSATTMLQRCVFLLQNRIDLPSTLGLDDAAWVAMLRRAAEGSVAEPLAEGLFGARRRLYKRIAEFNVVDGSEVHQSVARKPYWWLVACSEKLAERISSRTGIPIHPADILLDAPPVKLEVDIDVDVLGRDGTIRTLGDVSPVASALASRQFDNQVKQVRVFVRDDLRLPLRHVLGPRDWTDELLASAALLEQDVV